MDQGTGLKLARQGARSAFSAGHGVDRPDSERGPPAVAAEVNAAVSAAPREKSSSGNPVLRWTWGPSLNFAQSRLAARAGPPAHDRHLAGVALLDRDPADAVGESPVDGAAGGRRGRIRRRRSREASVSRV